MSTRPHVNYEFGPFRLESGERRLLREGQEILLRPKLFDLLLYLVEHRGKMLDKRELLRSVWKDISVEESNLAVSINSLRRTLGDERYIETVARHGYRFIGKVKILTGDATEAIRSSVAAHEPTPPGGALPLHSTMYIARSTDREFHTAIARRDSIVLVKGARQMGKTSLLARGMQQAREDGAAVVLTDFQHFSNSAFKNIEKLLLTLAEMISDQLDLPTPPHRVWNNFLSPSTNFERFLRKEVLMNLQGPLLWGLDEADRLFNFEYASEIFGLIRSWHNLRALEPGGPWHRLTLAMAYATEAHLFITDLNQSPFNVGTRLTLEDFTLKQLIDLDNRYGQPLGNEERIHRFYQLVGGHPYLTQRGLYEMVRRGVDLDAIEREADHDEGLFGDHLSRMLISLKHDPALYEGTRLLLDGQSGLTLTAFYRLRSAGILLGDSPQEARMRCQLYVHYLRKHLQ